MNELWLPKHYCVKESVKIECLEANGDQWQIVKTSDSGCLLMISVELYNKLWLADLIPENSFERFDISSKIFYMCFSGNNNVISHTQKGPYPQTSNTCLHFAEALKKTRDVFPDLSLFDSIFIEKYNCLLPLSTDEKIGDDIVFGTWLAGGVRMSTQSLEKLSKHTPYLSFSELLEVISLAGLQLNISELFPVVKNNNRILKQEQNITQSLNSRGYFHLPGRQELETFFNEQIIDIIQNEDKYKRVGIDFPSSTILYGPPGCGKTYAVKKLAEFIGWNCFSIDSSTIASPYIHETSKKISEVFNKAIKNSPSILVIDEMEAYLTTRGAAYAGINHTEEVAEFLRRIPEAINNKVLIFAMTNRIDDVDPAILRKGRFDHVIEVSYPSAEEVELLLNELLQRRPIANDVDISKISVLLSGKPLSDVAYIVREAGRIAAKEGKELIDQDCFLLAINERRGNDDSSATDDEMTGYQ